MRKMIGKEQEHFNQRKQDVQRSWGVKELEFTEEKTEMSVSWETKQRGKG